MLRPIEISKPGTFRAMDGTEVTFSEVDLREAAGAYDPELLRASLVIGHPKTADPAYGLVRGLEFSGNRLLAEPDEVDKAFAEMVNSGRFHTISASFYTKTSPENPKPGVYYLRHVGFLGAMPPALKGLKRPQISFQADERGVISFEFSAAESASMWRRLREWFIATFGTEKADEVVPDYAVRAMERDADTVVEESIPTMVGFTEQVEKEKIMKNPTGGTPPSGSETPPKPPEVDFAERQANLDHRETEISKREQELADKAVAARRVEFQEFVKSLSGRLPIGQHPVLVEMLMAIPAGSTIEFGEGATKAEKPLVDLAKEFFAGLPDLVTFREVAGGTVVQVDQSPEGIARRAQEYQDEQAQKGNNLSFSECVKYVSKGAS